MAAQEIFDKAFSTAGRTPRSAAYRAGVLQLLKLKLHKVPMACLYAPGTAEFDAFHAGVDEGHALVRKQAGEVQA